MKIKANAEQRAAILAASVDRETKKSAALRAKKARIVTPRDIITKHGGPSRVAELTGYSPGAVRLWKHRDRFPRQVWPELVKSLGLRLDDLMKMEYRAWKAKEFPK